MACMTKMTNSDRLQRVRRGDSATGQPYRSCSETPRTFTCGPPSDPDIDSYLATSMYNAALHPRKIPHPAKSPHRMHATYPPTQKSGKWVKARTVAGRHGVLLTKATREPNREEFLTSTIIFVSPINPLENSMAWSFRINYWCL